MAPGMRATGRSLGIPKAKQAVWVESRMPRRDTAEDWRAIAAFRLLIFTGARESEILTLQWEWIAAMRDATPLPDSKTGPKNLYLTPGVLAVLAELPRMAVNPNELPGDPSRALHRERPACGADP